MNQLTTRSKLWITIGGFIGLLVGILLLNAVVAQPRLHGKSAIAYSGNEWLFSASPEYQRDSQEKYPVTTVYAPWKEEVVELETFGQPWDASGTYGSEYSFFVREKVLSFNPDIGGYQSEVTVYANIDGSMIELPLPEGYSGQPFFELSPNEQFLGVYSREMNAMWILNLQTGEWTNPLETYLSEEVQAAYEKTRTDSDYFGTQSGRYYWDQEYPAVLTLNTSINDSGHLVQNHPGEQGEYALQYFIANTNTVLDAAEFKEFDITTYELPEKNEQYTCGDPVKGDTLIQTLFNGFQTCSVEYVDQYDIELKRRLFGKQSVTIVDTDSGKRYEAASWYAFFYPQQVETNFFSDDGKLFIRVDDKLYIADPVHNSLELFTDLYDTSDLQYPLPHAYEPFPALFLQ